MWRSYATGIARSVYGAGVVGVRAARGLLYLLRDDFTTDQAAPLPSPRVAEPGPGGWTVSDAVPQLSVQGGTLRFMGDPTGQNRYASLTSTQTFGRGNGLATFIDARRDNSTGNYPFCGFSTSAMFVVYARGAFSFASGDSIIPINVDSAQGLPASWLPNVWYRTGVVLRPSAGGYLFHRTLSESAYRLLWVWGVGNESPLYVGGLFGRETTAGGNADNWHVLHLGQYDPRFTTDDGLALTVVTSASGGTTLTMPSNALVEATWTPQAGQVFEIDVRRVDANNRWIVRCDQAAGTFALIERTNGSEVSRSSASVTWTAGTPYRIVVTCDGTEIVIYRTTTGDNPADRLRYASATAHQTGTQCRVSLACTRFVVWPRYVTLPAGV